MKTIHPTGLANLIARQQLFDLIDVRTKQEFEKAHIPGARSVPLSELRAGKFLHDRKLSNTEPVYVICRSRVLAGLASGALEGAGCKNAVVVDGGMETWETLGLPVVRRQWFPKVTADAPMVALIAGLGFGLGLAVHEIFFLVPLALGFGALFLKIHSFARCQASQSHAVKLADSNAVENWTVPHLSRLVSQLDGKELVCHPHHRVRFATAH